MLIKLLAGGCGYEQIQPDGTVIRRLKTPDDPAFDCPEGMALAMIESGQAKAVTAEVVLDPVDETKADQLSQLTMKELKAMAEMAGLVLPAKITKTELIEALADEEI